MKLHTVGDSHAEAAWKNIKPSDTKFDEILINTIGPVTMSRFGFEKLNVLNISTFYERSVPPPIYDHYFNIQKGDAVVFCFGEIDCRQHLVLPEYWAPNFYNMEYFESLNYVEMIDELVDRYFQAVKLNVEKVDSIHTMIFNIVPTPRNKTIPFNKTFPLVGTDEQRKRIALYMNKKLKEYCELNQYIFFDVYDKYGDSEGYLITELSSHVHVENPIHYIEFLNNLNL